jgi:SPP1 family predicted phage head-tail adaptor
MLFRDVVELITVVNTVNDMKDPIKTPSYREVFANKKSIRQNEFYQAAATGLRPELMFEIRTIEYEGERQIRYNKKTYNIIRTYDKNEEITELICSGVVNR